MEQKAKKKGGWTALIVLLILVALFLAWFFWMKNKKTTASKQPAPAPAEMQTNGPQVALESKVITSLPRPSGSISISTSGTSASTIASKVL